MHETRANMMIGQNLVIRQEEYLPTIVVGPIIKMISLVDLCLLIFVCDQPRHDVDVPWLSLDYFFPFFVEIILTPAKEVIVVTQCLELAKFCSA